MVAVGLFSWLAETPVYRDLHLDAARLAHPTALGEKWVDVGCGPGLITRDAASRGYDARGIDLSPRMIAEATRLANRHRSPARFEVGDARHLTPASADVVFAASLLYVVPDPTETAAVLFNAVRPGGALIVVETTAAMTPAAVRQLDTRTWSGRGRRAVSLWALARQGRALDPIAFPALSQAETVYHPLLSGLVGAWVFRRPGSAGDSGGAARE